MGGGVVDSTSHASQEDDYDRLPMPTGRPVETALDFPGFAGCPVVAWPNPKVRRQVEEIDLKLPPKPKSQLVAEAAAKKLEKKKEKDMVRSTQSCKILLYRYVDFNSFKGHKNPFGAGFWREGSTLSLREAEANEM